MHIQVTGVLRTPTYEVLPDHVIRVIAISTQDTIKYSPEVYTTDSEGVYDFNLVGGLYTLEVLYSDTYMLTGSLLVNEATPDGITLEELLAYSTNVEYTSLFPTITGDFTTSCSRVLKDQINSDTAYTLVRQETITDDSNDVHEASSINLVGVNDATVHEEIKALSDELQALKGLLLTLQENQINKTTTLDESKGKITETITFDNHTSSITHTNYGYSSLEVDVDQFKVGDTLEVIDESVVINGTLQVNGIQDADGNTLKDGDTIFMVHQYSDASIGGTWEDTRQSYHTWARDNWSINGVVDDADWGTPYQIGKGDSGTDGDTIYWEQQYSVDGITDWHSTLSAGDAYKRERQITNGVAGDWSDVVKITGDDGSTIEIKSQYSVDGIYNWHYTYAEEDAWERRARFVNDVQDGAWGDPFPIGKGDDGYTPVKGVDYFDGVDGSFVSYVYITASTQPDTPTDGSFDGTTEIPPTDWSDNPVYSTTDKTWVSTVRYSSDGTTWSRDSAWSEPVQWLGQNGDTIYTEYQYSTDGSSNWHDDFEDTDYFRRERIVTVTTAAITYGDWSDGTRIRLDGSSVYQEYRYGATEDTTDDWTDWGELQRDTDFWAQRRTVENGTVTETSSVYRIVGFNGAGWYTLEGYSGVFPSDAVATTEFYTNFGRLPQRDDHLTYVDSLSNTTASEIKRCISVQGTAVSSIEWSTPALAIKGDAIIQGTLSGNRIIADSLNGNSINSATTIITGSGSETAGLNGDDTSDSDYADWRMWAGASTPSMAPYRVYKDGSFYASNAYIEGEINATSGTFSGDLQAAGGTFSGTLDGVDGTFTGTIQASQIEGSNFVLNGQELGIYAAGSLWTAYSSVSGSTGWIDMGSVISVTINDQKSIVISCGGVVAYYLYRDEDDDDDGDYQYSIFPRSATPDYRLLESTDGTSWTAVWGTNETYSSPVGNFRKTIPMVKIENTDTSSDRYSIYWKGDINIGIVREKAAGTYYYKLQWGNSTRIRSGDRRYGFDAYLSVYAGANG